MFLFSTWTQKASTDNGGQKEEYTVNLVVHKGILMKLNGDVHQFMCTLLNTTTASSFFFLKRSVMKKKNYTYFNFFFFFTELREWWKYSPLASTETKRTQLSWTWKILQTTPYCFEMTTATCSLLDAKRGTAKHLMWLHYTHFCQLLVTHV